MRKDVAGSIGGGPAGNGRVDLPGTIGIFPPSAAGDEQFRPTDRLESGPPRRGEL